MIELKTANEIERMQPAGRLVAAILTELTAVADVGVNLLDLEHRARELVRDNNATSCYWDYAPSFGNGPFRNVVCTSVNDAVLHGLPHDYVLADGDLLSLDLAVEVDGWVADSAVSVIVGEPRPADVKLIGATRVALEAGIAAATVGNRIGDISAAIGRVAADYGYRPNTRYGGHGVGRTMHEDPSVPNNGTAGRGFPLRPGLVIAIEPWFLTGGDRIRHDRDGWTIRSADGSRGAHSEHTVAVTEDGPRVLTRRDSEYP
ncbi:MAG TPA: type I methionyl aminopeptidase [Candidatus Stackebrandtia excrementipullorum]|nr:type I methionyl aminopeptidase [Candidatus Stackebrandtia excrementipullorum]